MTLLFHDQIHRVNDSHWEPICLVGNKSDLDRERKVSTTEGLELAFWALITLWSVQLRTA